MQARSDGLHTVGIQHNNSLAKKGHRRNSEYHSYKWFGEMLTDARREKMEIVMTDACSARGDDDSSSSDQMISSWNS